MSLDRGDDWTTTSPYSEFSSPDNLLVTSITQREESTIPYSIALFPDLGGPELHLLEAILHKRTDVDKYLIGPSFRDLHQQAFVSHLRAAMPLLSDAFIACAPLVLGHQDLQGLDVHQHSGYKRAATAIASLRRLEVHCDNDVSTVLILGVLLVTFAAHHTGGELALCRHILALVKLAYDANHLLTQGLGSDGVSFLICILGTETIYCLLQGEVPTIKLRECDLNDLVDRFIGVSAPLLTHFYDVCEITPLIHRTRSRDGTIFMLGPVNAKLVKIEQAITLWQPKISMEYLTEHFTPMEVYLMVAQANLLRLTALLVAFRLRHAYGTRDKGSAIAHEILDELNSVVRHTGQSFPFADLAYLAASLEITGASERRAVIERSHLIAGFSPQFREDVETWIIAIWSAKDENSHGPMYWDDLGYILGPQAVKFRAFRTCH